MMKFLEIDYEKDLSEVIRLLNSNLDTTHTKEGFLWKHVENPFGKSYGLLALDREKIVGIRMFMRWQFERKSEIIKAVRPVDTCTEREYRGRGIFSGLTLACLENLEGQYDFIFNTPNANSRPGNLKLGWTLLRERGFRYKLGIPRPVMNSASYEIIKPVDIVFDSRWKDDVKVQTKLSPDFLRWRYRNNEYKLARFDTSEMVVFKVLKMKVLRAIVLVDFFGMSCNLSKYLYSICKRNNAPTVYYLDNLKNSEIKFLFQLSRGRQFVVSKEDRYNIGEQIHFSLGDLEARL